MLSRMTSPEPTGQYLLEPGTPCLLGHRPLGERLFSYWFPAPCWRTYPRPGLLNLHFYGHIRKRKTESSDIWIRNQNVPHQYLQIVTGSNELTKRAPGRPEGVKLVHGQPIFADRPAKICELVGKGVHDLRVHGNIDAILHCNITGIKPELPGIRRGDHNVSSDQFTPMHVIAESGRKKANPVASVAEQSIGALKNGNSRPFRIARIDRNVLFFDQHLHPVIEPTHHDCANRAHAGDISALSLAPCQPALHRLSDRYTLRQAETDRCVDADSPVCRFLDSRNSRTRGRNFHDHVRGQAGELLRLLDDGLAVPE